MDMTTFKPEVFEKELRDILDEKFIRRAVNLKRTGNIFSPLFYLLFTRIVELSSILNDVVLPNQLEVTEMFRTRKEFLQLDYGTINEAVKRVWVFEKKRDSEYAFSKSLEDFMYIIYRMRDIQKQIDSLFLRSVVSWDKDTLTMIYFTMLKAFLEIEEEINQKVKELNAVDYLRKLILNMFSGEKRKEVEELIFAESDDALLELFRSVVEGNKEDERVSKFLSALSSLSVSERLAIVKSIEAMVYNK
jgi:hypothetical protein